MPLIWLHLMKATALQGNTYLDELWMGIQSSGLELFGFKVDKLYKLAVQQHHNLFHFVNEPLLSSSSTKTMLYEEMSNWFPMHCTVLNSICTDKQNLCGGMPLLGQFLFSHFVPYSNKKRQTKQYEKIGRLGLTDRQFITAWGVPLQWNRSTILPL